MLTRVTRALFLDRDGIINERLVGEYDQTLIDSVCFTHTKDT